MSDTRPDLGDTAIIKTDIVLLSSFLYAKRESGDKQVHKLSRNHEERKMLAESNRVGNPF